MRLEKSLQSVCGGQRGPRARLTYMMGEQSEKLFGTQAIRGGAILGGSEGSKRYQHEVKMRGREQQLQEEREMYRQRAVLLRSEQERIREDYDREQRASTAPTSQSSLLGSGGINDQSTPRSPDTSRAEVQQRASTAPSPQVEKTRSDSSKSFSIPLSGGLNLSFPADKIGDALGQVASKAATKGTKNEAASSPRADAWAPTSSASTIQISKTLATTASSRQVYSDLRDMNSLSKESSVLDDLGPKPGMHLRASRTDSSTGALEVWRNYYHLKFKLSFTYIQINDRFRKISMILIMYLASTNLKTMILIVKCHWKNTLTV